MRRDFSLPEQDADFLDKLGYHWEAAQDRMGNWLIIQDYPVPPGYQINKVKLALKIDPGYPVSQIDMVYFLPGLQKINGTTINALAQQSIDGAMWQRWSRHRTGENPWRPDVDDISTHLQMVNYWMEREINK